MSKEIIDIITAFKEAQHAGRQTALATVVHVEGSSYRRPGARMLVEDNGKITGAISGGCLEGDALRKALLAIHQQQNKLVTYNTLDEDDVKFGVQLGCNGIVHILFEPINAAQTDNPIALLEKCTSQRRPAVLVTLFSLKNYHGRQPGTCFFFDGLHTVDLLEEHALAPTVRQEAASVLGKGSSSALQEYPEHELAAFIELLQPAVNLVLVGAGNDAMPLVDMATVLGWQTTVIDGRSTHADKQRFSTAYQVIVGKPADVIEQISFDERTFVVLMTHNYNYDLAMLELLLKKNCRYIGTLGPNKRLQRLLNELEQNGVVISEEQRNSIHGPVGLDIGAEGAEEIALSILAEIKAVLANRHGSFLRDRPDVIHARPVSNNVGIILLAGGGSSRLGRAKQLLIYKGQTLLQYSLQAALDSHAQKIVAVLGSDADKMQNEIHDARVQVVVNKKWQEGMASSVRCGIKAISPAAESVIIMVCDQPFVTAELLNELINAHKKTGKPIVVCGYENTFGPPALFHQSLFDELLELKGDVGARGIIKQHANEVEVVPFANGTYDIDTEADYEKVKSNSE